MRREKLVRFVTKYGVYAVYALFFIVPLAVLAGGQDDCPGLAIAALPYSDSGTTVGANNSNNSVPASCNGVYTTTAGPDKIYSITVGTGNSVTFTLDPTGANWDPSIYLLSNCANGTTCAAGWGDDNGGANVTEVVGPLTLPPGTYYFYVDSFYGAMHVLRQGTYDLTVTGTLGGPVAVTLATFEAASRSDHVAVTWQTTIEQDTVGFNLLRSTAADTPGTPINAALIPAQGAGTPYRWADPDVTAATTYFYWLEAVDSAGGTVRHGPVSVQHQTTSAVTLTTLAAPSNARGLAAGLLLTAAVGWVALVLKRRTV